MVKRSSSFVASDNSSGDERPAKTSKKAKQETKKGSSSKNGTNVDSEGNTFFEVSHPLTHVSPKTLTLYGRHKALRKEARRRSGIPGEVVCELQRILRGQVRRDEAHKEGE